MKSNSNSQSIEPTDLKKNINKILTEEFNDSFHDILILTRKEFTAKFLQRVNGIISSYYPNLIPLLKENKVVFSGAFRLIFEEYYAPIKQLCEAAAAYQGKKEVLTNNFHLHCDANKLPTHICGGQFILVKGNFKDQNYKYVVCDNCRYVYNTSCILMSCSKCDEDFFSAYNKNLSSFYQAATWKKYHCGIGLNQQMKCNNCEDFLWLKGTTLICKTCKKEWEPQTIKWICFSCKEAFYSKAKVYNPLDFYSMKICAKNAIANNNGIKPTVLPCQCDINPLKLVFTHKLKCNGVLYEGNGYRKKIIVCGKCRSFTSINKFVWLCPICKKEFTCTNCRVMKNMENMELFIGEELGKNDSSRSRAKVDSYRYNYYQTEERGIKSENKMNLITDSEDAGTDYSNKSKYKSKDNYLSSLRNSALCQNKIGIDLDSARKEKRYLITNSNEFKFDNEDNKKKENFITTSDFENSHTKLKSFQDGSTTNNKLSLIASNGNLKGKQSKNAPTQGITTKRPGKAININDYTIITQLGEGTFGKIYLVEDKEKNLFSLKKMIGTTKSTYESLSKEYEEVSKYVHYHIVSILGIYKAVLDETTYSIYILMEVGKTDWEKEITQRQVQSLYYTENELINILKQLVSALVYLQKNNVSHRDIKTQNVLVFTDNIYKVADFGEAKQFENSKPKNNMLNTLRGTELYMSPILFNGGRNGTYYVKHNTYKSDVFSGGMCGLFAMTLNIKVLCKVRDCTDNVQLHIFLYKILKPKYSDKIFDLLSSMMSISEESRPDFIKLEEKLNNYDA